MTTASFTATGMASPCKHIWAPVDLIAHPPFLKSLLLRRNSIETRWPGLKRVWCRFFAFPSSAPHRAPLLCAPLIPLSSAQLSPWPFPLLLPEKKSLQPSSSPARMCAPRKIRGQPYSAGVQACRRAGVQAQRGPRLPPLPLHGA
jgi:hypothetical protein